MGGVAASQITDEELEALQLHCQGYTYAEIAALQGTDWHTTARSRVQRALEKSPKFVAHDYRTLKSLEYEQRRAEMRQARNKLARDLLIEDPDSKRVSERARTARSLAELDKALILLDEREAKLWGADAPQQIEVAATVDHTVTVEELFRDLLDMPKPRETANAPVIDAEIVDPPERDSEPATDATLHIVRAHHRGRQRQTRRA